MTAGQDGQIMMLDASTGKNLGMFGMGSGTEANQFGEAHYMTILRKEKSTYPIQYTTAWPSSPGRSHPGFRAWRYGGMRVSFLVKRGCGTMVWGEVW